jgi:hypothetical protein
MVKLVQTPIGKDDIIEYADRHSDFGFELKVVEKFTELGLACEHGGTYDDPVTQKPREFDIRATGTSGDQRIRIAAECKNLQGNCPLVVSCIPRSRDESFHEVVLAHKPRRATLGLPVEYARVVRCTGAGSIYRPGGPTGKACSQVGRLPGNPGLLQASDSTIYEKWAQALSSAYDLVERAERDAERGDHTVYLSIVLPLLVVPDGTLWRVIYDRLGARKGDPAQVDRISYFVNRTHSIRDVQSNLEYTMSHLEVVTMRGLTEFVGKSWKSKAGRNKMLSFDRALDIMNSNSDS